MRGSFCFADGEESVRLVRYRHRCQNTAEMHHVRQNMVNRPIHLRRGRVRGSGLWVHSEEGGCAASCVLWGLSVLRLSRGREDRQFEVAGHRSQSRSYHLLVRRSSWMGWQRASEMFSRGLLGCELVMVAYIVRVHCDLRSGCRREIYAAHAYEAS